MSGKTHHAVGGRRVEGDVPTHTHAHKAQSTHTHAHRRTHAHTRTDIAHTLMHTHAHTRSHAHTHRTHAHTRTHLDANRYPSQGHAVSDAVRPAPKADCGAPVKVSMGDDVQEVGPSCTHTMQFTDGAEARGGRGRTSDGASSKSLREHCEGTSRRCEGTQ